MKRFLSALALIALTATAASAATSFFALEFSAGNAEVASTLQTNTTDYISAFDHAEVGLRGEYWHMLSEDYAFTLAAGIGMFREVDQPGDSAPAGSGDRTYTESSWNVRVGGDRVVGLGQRSHLYFGPGVEFWSGKHKFEDETPPASSYESENTMRISLSGRIGAHMMIGEGWGVTLQAGHKVGYASSEEVGAKATWWTGSTEGAVGLLFRFGAQ